MREYFISCIYSVNFLSCCAYLQSYQLKQIYDEFHMAIMCQEQDKIHFLLFAY